VETTRQISVFLENKPGRLANVLQAVAREKGNIIAMTIMDSHEHSVLRFVVDDLDRARRALKNLGTPFTETEVTLVELRNQPAGVFKVSNAAKAVRVLGESQNNSMRRRLQRPLRDRQSYSPPGTARR
jgi:hypothetical protein